MTGTMLTEEQRLSLLLRQIKWAEEKTAFYRSAFERAGVSAASVSSFAEMARLPFWEHAEEEGADAPFFMLTLPLSGLLRMSLLHAAVPDTIITWEHELPTLEKCLGDIAVHRLITVGEHPAPQRASRVLAERMGARHTHIFTLAQMGALIGVSCTAGAGLHLEERLFYAEVVDESGHSARAGGACGQLVLSTIAAEAMPVLRYQTGLQVRLARGRCACGSTQLLIIEE